jgi:hypothetical protein
MNNIIEKYLIIKNSWENNENNSYIYYMIYYWIKLYKNKFKSIESHNIINNIIIRINSDDNMKDIINDFLYSNKYNILRKEMYELNNINNS